MKKYIFISSILIFTLNSAILANDFEKASIENYPVPINTTEDKVLKALNRLYPTTTNSDENKILNENKTEDIQNTEKFKAENLLLLKEKISTSKDTMHQFGAKEAINEIKKNILLIQQINEKVKKANHIDEVIEDVANGLIKIANSYKAINENKNQIFKTYSEELNKLISTKELSHLTLEEIKTRKVELNSKIKTLEENKQKYKDKDYMFKAEKNFLKGLIKNAEVQEEIWDEFYKAQAKLIDKTNQNKDNLEDFFKILSFNAQLYQSTADTAILRKKAKSVLENLNINANIGDVMRGIENTWFEINDIVEKMGADFEKK